MRSLELMEKATPMRDKRCVITSIYDTDYTGILVNIVFNDITQVKLVLLMDDGSTKEFFFNKVKNIKLYEA